MAYRMNLTLLEESVNFSEIILQHMLNHFLTEKFNGVKCLSVKKIWGWTYFDIEYTKFDQIKDIQILWKTVMADEFRRAFYQYSAMEALEGVNSEAKNSF